MAKAHIEGMTGSKRSLAFLAALALLATLMAPALVGKPGPCREPVVPVCQIGPGDRGKQTGEFLPVCFLLEVCYGYWLPWYFL